MLIDIHSKIQIVSRKKLQEDKYLQLLDRTTDASYYNDLLYLDQLAENCDFLIVNDYQAVLPLPYTVRLFSKCLTNPVFSRCVDWLGEKVENTEELFPMLKKKYARAQLNIGNITSENVGFETKYFQIIEKEEELIFNSQCKRNLKKLSGLSYVIESVTLSSVLPDINHMLTFKVGGFRDLELQKFNRLLKKIERVNLRVRTLNFEGEVLAMALYCDWKDRVYYLKGATTEKGKPFAAMQTLLLDEIEKTLNKGKVFSFEGSNVPNVARFNYSFGAKNIAFSEMKWNHAGKILNFILKIRKKR